MSAQYDSPWVDADGNIVQDAPEEARAAFEALLESIARKTGSDNGKGTSIDL